MTSSSEQTRFRAALVQMCSGQNVEKNVSDATALIREAARGGAQYVQTPEVTTLMELSRRALVAACEPEQTNTALKAFQTLAHELDIWLHIGSIPILINKDTRPQFANRSYLLAPTGGITARYDKIHMFDVALPNGETYAESSNYHPGDKAVVADTPWGGLGMTICYDLRFPQLHRTLAQAGAKFIAIPAAFTKPTGEAHWHTLVRARAIETQCFVFAATQGGTHEHGRDTFGHSLIVSPWGEILGEGNTNPGVIIADIDLAALDDARARVPSLTHDREFTLTRAHMPVAEGKPKA